MGMSDYVLSIEEAKQDDFGYVEPDMSEPKIGLPMMIQGTLGNIDQICAAAASTETADIVAGEAHWIKEMIARCHRTLHLLDAREAPLKVVRRVS